MASLRKMALGFLPIIFLLLSACSGPNQANIELRKNEQKLEAQIKDLQNQRDADQLAIRALQSHATTVPTLPEDRIDQLYTTTGLQFGKLTGGYRPDPNQPADTRVKVYVVPTDQQGDVLKAAGSFHVELFDLAMKPEYRVGVWDFDIAATKSLWYGSAMLYTYVLDCPWQTPPQHEKLTMRLTFTDALTQRVISVDRDVTVRLGAVSSVEK